MTRSVDAIIDGLVVKAIKTWDLIRDGESILLGASGGKDSLILARDLINKQKQGRLNARIAAVHIAADFGDTTNAAAQLKALYESWGVEFSVLPVAVRGRLKEGRSMNCYWCSMQRRTELIRYALAHGFTSIALGHHLDDVLETLFMNMMHKGELSTMPPAVRYKKYPLSVIRPLYLVEERHIRELASSLGYTAFTCTCEYNTHSERALVRQRVEALTNGSSRYKRAIIRSLGNINPEYLPR